VADGWFIPCLATWTDIAAAPLPPCWDALKQAALQVGGRQIQNAGTVIGNLCNASPAADGIPCLLAMNASVELASAAGSRRVPISEFVLGPRTTIRRPQELVLGLHIPDRGGVSRFEKLGARSYLVISIAMVAAWLRLDHGVIAEASIAVGACGPRAILLPELAGALVGQDCARANIDPSHLAALSPIDDVRAPAWYRREAARVLVERAVRGLARPAAIAA
jgi:CO/xanthine dehydrogenase FAD-binding subunit